MECTSDLFTTNEVGVLGRLFQCQEPKTINYRALCEVCELGKNLSLEIVGSADTGFHIVCSTQQHQLQGSNHHMTRADCDKRQFHQNNAAKRDGTGLTSKWLVPVLESSKRYNRLLKASEQRLVVSSAPHHNAVYISKRGFAMHCRHAFVMHTALLTGTMYTI